MKAKTFKLTLIPLNENQELNYREEFKGTETQLLHRVKSMNVNLSKAMPKGDFMIKLENHNKEGIDFHYKDGKFLSLFGGYWVQVDMK